MSRAAIPSRRPNATLRVVWRPELPAFHVTVGFDPRTGQPCEVFCSDGMKTGTDMRHTVEDACVLISLLLQHGVTVCDIGKSLGGSVVAAVVGAIAGEPGKIAPTPPAPPARPSDATMEKG